MNKSVLIAVVVIVVLGIGGFLIFGKSNKNSSTTSSSSSMDMSNMSSSSSSSSTPVATNAVSVVNFSYSPTSITVKKGTKVTWTNNDSTQHTVTADNGSFDSGTLDPGKSFSQTFNTAGTFAYHCNFHSNMHGTVIVQ